MRYILKSFIICLALCAFCFGQDQSKPQITIKTLPAELNSEYNDYAPCVTPDGKILYFSSDRKENSLGKSDMFFVEISNGVFSKVKNPGSSYNTDDYEGAISIAADGKTIAFAANGRSDGMGNEDIYIAELNNGKVTNVKNPGPKVNSKYWDSQPSISADGKTIYFSSNRKDGQGKEDIWVTKQNPDGSWSEAQNLGEEINTGKNERSPFITPDGSTLYFSSDGHEGEGGKDIFFCKPENGKWSMPINLGPPVNTKWDESFPFTTANSDEFYFVSDKKGGQGKLDIYAGTPNILIKIKPKLIVSIVDSVTGKPIPAQGEIIEIPGKSISKFEVNPAKPEYNISLELNKQYRIKASGEGYTSKEMDASLNSGIPENKVIIRLGKPQPKPILVDKPAAKFKLVVSFLDSLSGLPLPAEITITDMQTNEKSVINTNEKDFFYTKMLPPDRDYRVEGKRTGQETVLTEMVNSTKPNSVRTVKFIYGPIILKEFNFAEKSYKIPFFVSGYYRPNTPENLDGLYPLLENNLKKATYIERFEKNSARYKTYKDFAEVVSDIFNTVYAYAVDTCFPYFKSNMQKSEVLEIVVIGHVDPRPTSGVYNEKDEVKFEDFQDQKYQIKKGQKIDNFILSGLRAWYSGKFLDELFGRSSAKGKTEYKELIASGKIRYKYVAGFINREGFDFEAQRNIRILFTRAKK